MQSLNIKEKSKSGKDWVFEVEVKEGNSSTTHIVTVKKDDHKRLAPGHAPSELVWASFLFLLDRESKESILPEFDLMLISKYFPEYEKEIKKYL